MLLTEDEARQKWCPHVSLCEVGGAIYDNRGQSHGFTRCIASECMSWRWSDERRQGTIVSVKETDGTEREVIRGYCGLSGKVE